MVHKGWVFLRKLMLSFGFRDTPECQRTLCNTKELRNRNSTWPQLFPCGPSDPWLTAPLKTNSNELRVKKSYKDNWQSRYLYNVLPRVAWPKPRNKGCAFVRSEKAAKTLRHIRGKAAYKVQALNGVCMQASCTGRKQLFIFHLGYFCVRIHPGAAADPETLGLLCHITWDWDKSVAHLCQPQNLTTEPFRKPNTSMLGLPHGMQWIKGCCLCMDF